MIEEIKIIKEPEVLYKTSDGEMFRLKENAEFHEKTMQLNEKMRRLKSYKCAYYCKTQEDFDLLLDWLAYNCCDLKDGLLNPCYLYAKSEFRGTDWYFIDPYTYERYKDKEIKLKIQTLTDKKEEFILECQMFSELGTSD